MKSNNNSKVKENRGMGKINGTGFFTPIDIPPPPNIKNITLADTNEIVKLLNTLMEDYVSRQIYKKQIKLLWEMLEFQSKPSIVINNKGKL